MKRTALFIALITTLTGLWAAKTTADINLTQFKATWETDVIHVVWETSSELDTIEYYLYRAESLSGPWDEYIYWVAAEGDESTPASYSYYDPEVIPGGTYYYLLEEVTSEDSNRVGPITPSPSTSQDTSTPTQDTSQATNTPTATRTPSPANTVLGTTFTPPAQTSIPPPSAVVQLTRFLTPRITTPTPVGGPGESVPTPVTVPSMTPSPSGGATNAMITSATATASATPTPAAQPPAGTSTPTETPQRLAAVRKETVQPLLNATAAQVSPGTGSPGQSPAGPNAIGPGVQSPDARLIRLLSVLGGAALVAAALLGAIAVLTWRLHSR